MYHEASHAVTHNDWTTRFIRLNIIEQTVGWVCAGALIGNPASYCNVLHVQLYSGVVLLHVQKGKQDSSDIDFPTTDRFHRLSNTVAFLLSRTVFLHRSPSSRFDDSFEKTRGRRDLLYKGTE